MRRHGVIWLRWIMLKVNSLVAITLTLALIQPSNSIARNPGTMRIRTSTAVVAAEEAGELFTTVPLTLRLSVSSYDPLDDRRTVEVIGTRNDRVALDLTLIIVKGQVVFMTVTGPVIQQQFNASEKERRIELLIHYLEKWTSLKHTKTVRNYRRLYTRLVFCCTNNEVFHDREE